MQYYRWPVYICQLCTNATASAKETGAITSTTKNAYHTSYTSPNNLLVAKKHPPLQYRDECMPLVRLWIPSTTTYDLCVTQHNNINDFPASYFCRKCIPCFYAPFLYHTSDKKRVRNIASSVCVLLIVHIFLARVQIMPM